MPLTLQQMRQIVREEKIKALQMPTKNGQSLTVFVDEASLEKTTFHFLDRVKTLNNSGVVIGLAQGKLWFLFDGDAGVTTFGNNCKNRRECASENLTMILRNQQNTSHPLLQEIFDNVSLHLPDENVFPQVAHSEVEELTNSLENFSLPANSVPNQYGSHINIFFNEFNLGKRKDLPVSSDQQITRLAPGLRDRSTD